MAMEVLQNAQAALVLLQRERTTSPEIDSTRLLPATSGRHARITSAGERCCDR